MPEVRVRAAIIREFRGILVGKAPLESYQWRVDSSWQNRNRSACHEEVEVFGEPDREHPEGSRERGAAGGSDAAAWVQPRLLLQMESQVVQRYVGQ